MPWLTLKIRVKTDGIRKRGAGGTVTRLCVHYESSRCSHHGSLGLESRPVTIGVDPVVVVIIVILVPVGIVILVVNPVVVVKSGSALVANGVHSLAVKVVGCKGGI